MMNRKLLQTLALRVRQEAERFQCPEVQLMAEERLALAALLLDQPEAALAHAQACTAVIHRPPLLIAGAVAALALSSTGSVSVLFKTDEGRS